MMLPNAGPRSLSRYLQASAFRRRRFMTLRIQPAKPAHAKLGQITETIVRLPAAAPDITMDA